MADRADARRADPSARPRRNARSSENIVAALTGALADAGALPLVIDVRVVDAVAKTPLGKTPLIKAIPRGEAVGRLGRAHA